jgi:hypothetical protein
MSALVGAKFAFYNGVGHANYSSNAHVVRVSSSFCLLIFEASSHIDSYIVVFGFSIRSKTLHKH